jgi:hypothetical protein
MSEIELVEQQPADKEKYKDAIWESIDNLTAFHALVSNEQLIGKGIERLISTIAKYFNLEVADITVNTDDLENYFISWIDPSGLYKKKSEVLVYETGNEDEIQITITVKN